MQPGAPSFIVKRGVAEARRGSESRAVNVGEIGQSFHHLRVGEGFGLDAADEGEIGRIGTVLGGQGRDGQKAEAKVSHGCSV